MNNKMFVVPVKLYIQYIVELNSLWNLQHLEHVRACNNMLQVSVWSNRTHIHENFYFSLQTSHTATQRSAFLDNSKIEFQVYIIIIE